MNLHEDFWPAFQNHHNLTFNQVLLLLIYASVRNESYSADRSSAAFLLLFLFLIARPSAIQLFNLPFLPRHCKFFLAESCWEMHRL